MGAAVSILVFLVLGIGIRKRPRRDPHVDPSERVKLRAHEQPGVHEEEQTRSEHSAESRALKWVLLGGVLLPLLVIVPLFFYSVVLQGQLQPEPDPDLVVEIEGRQWWWVVRYRTADPQSLVTSANELHIPTGRRVQLRLSSPDVIHSLWVPSLQGKMDLIPGRETVTWLEADEPGVYRGQCAEYCGLQHAHMALFVIAHEPAEFDAWLANERQPVPPQESEAPQAPTGASQAADTAHEADSGTHVHSPVAGRDVFMQKGCGVCHAVRGTVARGTIGPDLTHVASRRSLAAGTLPNTRGHLAAWITNPQVIKPGNRMPRVPLTSAELHAMIAWLETLR
ncbi:MAG TPA: cytochrome c oxidase subunit II, partial [Longimicrobiales bacterium]|nr:cytochrome c oxidase subunit II [Longimicrobiales bacterium]